MFNRAGVICKISSAIAILLFERSKFLGNQTYHLYALLLSVAAHLGLGSALGIVDGGVSALGQRLSSEMITVYLSKSESAPVSSLPESIEYDKPGEEALAQSAIPSQVAQLANEEVPIIPILAQPEPHYFRSRELTEKPHIFRDISADLTLAMPDVQPQSVILRLLINELGDIDKIVIEDSSLPEDLEGMVIQTFSKMKFQPGRIDNRVVKSQLRIEVTLEDVVLMRK